VEAKGLGEIIGRHRLFVGLRQEFLDLVTGCAKNVRFKAGDDLCKEGHLTFQSAGPDEVVGLSWLVPPYRWNYDARAVEDTRAIAINTNCLRTKCEADSALGYEVMKRFMPTIVERLHATRLQLLDLYGNRKSN
jgi:CRP/FNR family cyclic AMP-dependent transcriptional regulator